MTDSMHPKEKEMLEKQTWGEVQWEADSRRKIAKIDQEYTSLCTELGDLSLRQEELQLRIGAIRARVNQLRDAKKEAEKILAECLRPPSKEKRSAAEILESQMKCAEVPRE